VFVSTEQKMKAMEAAPELSGHWGWEGTLRKVVGQYWWPEMCVNVKDKLKMWEHCEMRAPLQYDEPLNSLSFSQLLQRVRMDISYMPKTEDGYHLQVVTREYRNRGAETRSLKQGIGEGSRLPSRRGNLLHRNPRKCVRGRRSRE
jgi:hypothetical protein